MFKLMSQHSEAQASGLEARWRWRLVHDVVIFYG